MTVTINGTDYPTYATLDEADEYWAGGFGDLADAWNLSAETGGTAEDNRRKGALSESYRRLSAAPWTPGATDDPDWQAAVITANIVYAGVLIEGSWAQSEVQSSSSAKRLKAGSVEIEYAGAFRATSKTVSQPTLPPDVKILMTRWLQTAVGAGALTFASGTKHCNELDADYRMIP